MILISLLAPLVWAARPPDLDRSERLVSALIEASSAGAIAPDRIDEWIRPPVVEGWSRERRQVWAEGMSRRLSPEGDIGRSIAGAGTVGVLEGPDYARVVLDGPPWLTFVVRRAGDGPRIERVETSACGLCEEPERFVADLVADVRAGRDQMRLLMGLDLYIGEDALPDGVDPVEWGRSFDRRNVHTGYLRWLLRDAEVASSWGEGVTVTLGERQETWSVAWRDERWMLDYASLPEDSPIRLAPEEVVTWKYAANVAQAVAEYWLPEMRPVGDAVLLAEPVMYAAPRRGRGELVLYNQDLGRTAAVLIRMDPLTGEVIAGRSLPLLSSRLQVAPFDWRSLFVPALSPDGDQLAVTVHTKLQVIDVETGDVVHETLQSSRAGAVAWSPSGALLASCDEVGAVLLLDTERWSVVGRAQAGKGCVSLAWRGDTVTAATGEGRVVVMAAPELTILDADEGICCGGVHSAAAVPGGGGLAVGCTAACAPIWRWEMPPVWASGGDALLSADERMSALSGTLSVDPSGRWMVAPWGGEGGAAALVALESGEPLRVFSEAPLVQISWDLSEDALYAVDKEGRLWRWSLSGLLAGPEPE